MADLGIEIELHYVGDEVRIVVPKQEGLSYEAVLPRLQALAATLTEELQLPVVLEGEPERHLHAPDGQTVSFGSRSAHGHAH